MLKNSSGQNCVFSGVYTSKKVHTFQVYCPFINGKITAVLKRIDIFISLSAQKKQSVLNCQYYYGGATLFQTVLRPQTLHFEIFYKRTSLLNGLHSYNSFVKSRL